MKNRNLAHSDNWETPQDFYNKLNNEFKFDFDPCPLNYQYDGLNIEWGDKNFINPPYSRKLKEAFVKKAIEESNKGKLCVLLLPVSTSTKLFHNLILPNKKEIRFIKGRLKFSGVNTKGEYVNNKVGMHDSMLVILKKSIRLGDLVYYITKYTGIRYVWKKLYPDCDCDKRRKKWNKIKL